MLSGTGLAILQHKQLLFLCIVFYPGNSFSVCCSCLSVLICEPRWKSWDIVSVDLIQRGAFHWCFWLDLCKIRSGVKWQNARIAKHCTQIYMLCSSLFNGFSFVPENCPSICSPSSILSAKIIVNSAACDVLASIRYLSLWYQSNVTVVSVLLLWWCHCCLLTVAYTLLTLLANDLWFVEDFQG